MKASLLLGTLLGALVTPSWALDVDLDDKKSVESALNLITNGLLDYYKGNQYGGTPGMFVDPYYWWEAGVAWSALIDRWAFTGNDTLNDMIVDAMQFQVGKDKDFKPSNQTMVEGNDDQGFWGIAAMEAAERNFTNPKDEDDPGWLALAQAVFNEFVIRWEDQDCYGGLRWQMYTWNNGYDYKNTVSNGCMFNLAARLHRYTGNTTYSDWADKIWEWINKVEFVENNGATIYDGASMTNNCSDHTKIQWSYNYGLFISGAAYMYNKTEKDDWKSVVQNIWKGASIFFDNGIMYEAACQPSDSCNNDQRCFKGIFAQFLGQVIQLVPDMADDIMKDLRTSASAAASSCSGGSDGHTCGLNWLQNKWDGKYGLGEQISALAVIQNTLVNQVSGPLTNQTGGSSKGNYNAGKDTNHVSLTENRLDISTKDRAGAGIITVLVIGGFLGTGFWMIK